MRFSTSQYTKQHKVPSLINPNCAEPGHLQQSPNKKIYLSQTPRSRSPPPPPTWLVLYWRGNRKATVSEKVDFVASQGGISPTGFLIREVSHKCGLINVVCYQCGLSSGRSLINVVSSMWFVISVVSHQGGLLPLIPVWSHQCGLLSVWSLIRVVCYH